VIPHRRDFATSRTPKHRPTEAPLTGQPRARDPCTRTPPRRPIVPAPHGNRRRVLQWTRPPRSRRPSRSAWAAALCEKKVWQRRPTYPPPAIPLLRYFKEGGLPNRCAVLTAAAACRTAAAPAPPARIGFTNYVPDHEEIRQLIPKEKAPGNITPAAAKSATGRSGNDGLRKVCWVFTRLRKSNIIPSFLKWPPSAPPPHARKTTSIESHAIDALRAPSAT